MNSLATNVSPGSAWDGSALRAQFAILQQEVNGRPLIYLDNAATTQKPQSVIDAVTAYYQQDNANVHRAAHVLSDRATRSFEAARARVARFLNAPEPETIEVAPGGTATVELTME